ncbi:Hypothetical protein SRAE_2000406700 [Strongyloides ratti]|uniref:Uncharacterized protein n=1 Tax=Strongyloides ratti TaxID=34506 RepID=A0A090LMM4_STRRB|nr:Hypothetical protein SRAE_2000406700 [Strongyloides ratti]CEF69418.1 Hypothetical protein SRAE_2000406700 [Strongyloides ratti]
MQSKFMLFVFLTLLFATYSECLKCNTYVKLKDHTGQMTLGGDEKSTTCERGQMCLYVSLEDITIGEGFITAACVYKDRCKNIKNGKIKNIKSDKFYSELSRATGRTVIAPIGSVIEGYQMCCTRASHTLACRADLLSCISDAQILKIF